MKKIIILLTLALMPFLCISASALDMENAKKAVDFRKGFDIISLAGTTDGDWIVIYSEKLELGFVDKEEYSKKLSKKLKNFKNVTDFQRACITFEAIGETEKYSETIEKASYGKTTKELSKQGINGLIWALIALDSGSCTIPENAKSTREEIVSEICKKQLTDGGFSLMGNVSDVDITSMAITALSPYYSENKQVLDNAVLFLNSKQLEDGSFPDISGNSSAISTAQAITAFSYMKIDTDIKVKNAKTALLKFQNNDGGFSLSYNNKKSNIMATDQALCAILSLQNNFTKEDIQTSITETEKNESTSSFDGQNSSDEKDFSMLWFLLAIPIIVIAIILLRKKK